MISDAIDYEEYKNNICPDGVFFSRQSFATKLSAGISMLIEGMFFKLVGFSDANVHRWWTKHLQGEQALKHSFHNM